MHRLRNARTLARLVLVWFALAVGAAVASPLIKPQSVALVCSGAGVLKILAAGDDAGAALPGAGLLDCPLCLHTSAPPPAATLTAGVLSATAGAMVTPVVQSFAVRHAGPAPGRGPPEHS
jgi:predicted short-subunit dehydrogenase-like oxidoreductase (DUF2520 family)